MEFGISKHTHITMEAGKRISPSEIELWSGEVTPGPESGKGYRNLVILEANEIMCTKLL